MRRLLLLVTLVLAQAIPATAQSREKDLDRWVERDLIPYVKQQLVAHPRFQNETVMFVVLEDNAPASSSNELALSLRDRLLTAAVNTAGVAVGWQHGRTTRAMDPRQDDCARNDVHYFVGLELTQELDSSYLVRVRALDLEDRNWVTGFGKDWQGRLNTIQRQAMRQQRADTTFLGARDVPFNVAQTDLLASSLAHQLSCTLKQQLEDEYVVRNDIGEPAGDGLGGTLELIGNNLAKRQALTLTDEAGLANAKLKGKAHHVDGTLYQYWLTVTPEAGNDSLTALSASAYVILPYAAPEEPVAKVAPIASATAQIQTTGYAPGRTISVPNAGKDGNINSLSIVAPQSRSDCGSPCSLLRTRANKDAIVFYLEHQAQYGLVRLGDAQCRQRTAAKVARRGDTLDFPIARTTTDSRNWTETYDWSTQPEQTTYYAVVVTDARAARVIANHVDQLPMRCSSSMRPGLQGELLQEWLTDFATMTAKSAQHIDWRAIRVRDVM
ncbi:MAG: hypothetical protein K0U72_16570 [Gammaproteobacteria bacterium]|nr:hypothetical protein [Gammaproteobacteria bacterium]